MLTKWMIGMLLCAFVSVQGEELIAHWDFTTGKINSADGKFEAKARGFTAIAENDSDGKFLRVGLSSKEKPEGIILRQKYPELSPKEGFRIEATVRLREQTSTQLNLVIWDSKYIFYYPKNDNPQYHHGFAFFLQRKGENQFQPIAWIGHGNQSSAFSGTPVTLQERKIYKLAFAYDGLNQGTFTINDNISSIVKTKVGGGMSPAVYNAIIGDRVGSTFNRFDGDIFEVRLFSFPKPKPKSE